MGGRDYQELKSHTNVLDLALRLVTEALLASDALDALADGIVGTAQACRDAHGAEAAACAADALDALALNIGVPRDMAEQSACAFRSHLRLVVEALRGTSSSVVSY